VGGLEIGIEPAKERFASIPRWGLFTEDHDELRRGIRQWIDGRLAPNADEWESARDFPYREIFKEAGGIGLFGAKYEEAYGGTGPDLIADAVITEETVRCHSGGVAAALGAHKDLGPYYVYRFGNEDQRQRWIVPAIAGEKIGALAVTEPDAGSDVGGITTRAVQDGGDWVLTGAKSFITNGSIADFVVVAAKTDPDAGHQGVSLFIVDADTPGFSSKRMNTVGWRTSHTGELHLDGVRVPAENLLGEENRGFYSIMGNFQWERVVMALAAVAAADLTLQNAIEYAKERHAFGRPIGGFGAIQQKLADMQTEIEAARALVWRAARLKEAGLPHTIEGAQAKLFASRVARVWTGEAIQVLGGYGYTREFPAERYYRDAKVTEIYEGTSEIQRLVIARALLGEAARETT
jgi:acyl-CoA dehydrogenase